MTPRNLVFVLLALSIAADRSECGVIRHDVPDSAYRALASEPQFAAVGTLHFEVGAFPLCTGTLIHPNWVLTAGHCVTNFSPPEQTTFEVNGQVHAVDDFVPHPRWANNPVAGYDLGLVRLAEPVTDVAPAIRNRTVEEIGREFVTVGFGETGDGLTGNAPSTEGVRRAGRNVFDQRGPFVLDFAEHILFFDFDHPDDSSLNQMGADAALPLEYMTAPGDSGSGAFIETAQGWRLAGVQSFGMRLTGSGPPIFHYGDAGGAASVREFNDWIDSVVPEPASLVLLLVGLPLLRPRA